jgi:hypothetical protein
MSDMPIVNLLDTGRALSRSGQRVSVLWQEPESLVFVARGREYRSEFHINPSDEVMYMIKGEMRLHYRTPDGKEAVALVPEGSAIHTPAGISALAALSARRLPHGDRAQAPARGNRPVPVVLPDVRRAAARRDVRGRRLSRRPGVEGVQELLRQRGIPHLQGVRHGDAGAVKEANSE